MSKSESNPPLMLNEGQAAELLGLSRRKLHELRQQSWFPLAFEFGPRALRWNRDELLTAVAQNAPRRQVLAEPKHLAQARIGRRVIRDGREVASQ